MTVQILLDSFLSLEIIFTVAFVNVEGTLLTSVGVSEDLMYTQQQLLILRVVHRQLLHLKLLPLQLLPLARLQDPVSSYLQLTSRQ
jgi:hypothetical protein